MTDVAFEILNRYKKPVAFQDLWQKVAKELNLTEEMAKKKKLWEKYDKNLSKNQR